MGDRVTNVGDCYTRLGDEGCGKLKENRFGEWMKAGGGAGDGGGRQISGWKSQGPNVEIAASPFSRRDFLVRLGGESIRINKHNQGADFSGLQRNSRLIEIEDDDRVSLNGKELKMRDLINVQPGGRNASGIGRSSHDTHVDSAKAQLGSGSSPSPSSLGLPTQIIGRTSCGPLVTSKPNPSHQWQQILGDSSLSWGVSNKGS